MAPERLPRGGDLLKGHLGSEVRPAPWFPSPFASLVQMEGVAGLPRQPAALASPGPLAGPSHPPKATPVRHTADAWMAPSTAPAVSPGGHGQKLLGSARPGPVSATRDFPGHRLGECPRTSGSQPMARAIHPIVRPRAAPWVPEWPVTASAPGVPPGVPALNVRGPPGP